MSGSNELEQFCMHCGHKITYLSDQAGSNVFCPKCGQSVQIQADASNPVKAATSQVAVASSDITSPADVHLSIDGQQFGPYTEAEIHNHLQAGQVAPTTLAWREGMAGWSPLSELFKPTLDQAVSQPVETNPQATIATSADPQPEAAASADIDDDAFKCTDCDKSFKSQGALKQHQKSKRHGNYQQLPADSVEDDENVDEEEIDDEGKEESSWADVLALGCYIAIACSVIVLVYGWLFGSSTKDELADFKKQLETTYIRAEAKLTEKINKWLDGGFFDPDEIGRLANAFHSVYVEGENTPVGLEKIKYKSALAQELKYEYQVLVVNNVIAWRVWVNMGPINNKSLLNGDIGPNNELITKKIYREQYQQEQTSYFNKLDAALKKHGLAPIVWR